MSNNLVSLNQIAAGATVRVVTLDGGRQLNRRLNQLGIHIGDMLTVRRNAMYGGPLLVSVQQTTLAIGYGMASKIKVKLTAHDTQPEL